MQTSDENSSYHGQEGEDQVPSSRTTLSETTTPIEKSITVPPASNPKQGLPTEEESKSQSVDMEATKDINSEASAYLTRTVERETRKSGTRTSSSNCSPAVLSSEQPAASTALEPEARHSIASSVSASSPVESSLLVGTGASDYMEHRRLSKDVKGANIRVRVREHLASSTASNQTAVGRNVTEELQERSDGNNQGLIPPRDKKQGGLNQQNLQQLNEKRGLPTINSLIPPTRDEKQGGLNQQNLQQLNEKRGIPTINRAVNVQMEASSAPLATGGSVESSKAPENETKQRIRLTQIRNTLPALGSTNAAPSSANSSPSYNPEHNQQPHEELAVATPVHEDSESEVQLPQEETLKPQSSLEQPRDNEADPNVTVVEARPVKVEDSAADLLSSNKGRCLVVGIIIIVILVAGGIAFGLTGFKSSIDDNNTQAVIDGSQLLDGSDESTTIASSTIAPTATPSLRIRETQSPTQYESQSPTTKFQDYVVSLLPDFTLVVLEDENSPQSNALKWITETPSNYTDARLLQRYALATLYYATSGMQWRFRRNWLSSAHECDWWSHLEVPGSPAGEVCNESLEYTALLLHQNVLQGTLPPEIALLSKLQEVVLSADDFQLDEQAKKERLLSKHIPSELALLTELEVLDLSKNAFSGAIPSELGLLDSLRELKLLQNILSSSIPFQLSQLDSLQELLLQQNRLEMQIPSELGLLSTNLQVFTAHTNMLIGSIPSELGQLRMLSQLNIQTNSLTSTIPSELGMLSNVKVFNLEENLLTGTLSLHFGELVGVTHFIVASNQLKGTIPLHFGNMTELRILGLQDNMLNGTIPSELSQLENVNTINLKNNNFIGVAPSEVCQLKEAKPVRFNLAVDCQEVECNCRCCNCDCDVVNTVGNLIPGNP